MALVKEIENEYGIDFKYHKIRDVRINTQGGNVGTQLIITVDSYATKDTRIGQKAPSTRQCVILGADFALEPFYKLLRAKFPEFSDAEDDMDNSFKIMDKPKVMQVISQTPQGVILNNNLEKTEEIKTGSPITDPEEDMEEKGDIK